LFLFSLLPFLLHRYILLSSIPFVFIWCSTTLQSFSFLSSIPFVFIWVLACLLSVLFNKRSDHVVLYICLLFAAASIPCVCACFSSLFFVSNRHHMSLRASLRSLRSLRSLPFIFYASPISQHHISRFPVSLLYSLYFLCSLLYSQLRYPFPTLLSYSVCAAVCCYSFACLVCSSATTLLCCYSVSASFHTVPVLFAFVFLLFDIVFALYSGCLLFAYALELLFRVYWQL
jgi:hypothetical protein